jgi:ethanolamine ammonia-lyase large subunit
MRRLFNLKPAPEFAEWLESAGLYREGEPALLDGPGRAQLLRGLESSLDEISSL